LAQTKLESIKDSFAERLAALSAAASSNLWKK